MISQQSKKPANLSKAAAHRYAGEGCISSFSPHNRSTVQARLNINKPNDVYEQEADKVADQIVAAETANVQAKLHVSSLQRKCAHCEEEEKNMQRKETGGTATIGNEGLETYVSSLNGRGQALPPDVRNFYEPRFGHDFSNVRVHTDSVAAKSAESVNALAYTSGSNIVFNEGQYSSNTEAGKKLLAHELTHVVQQGAASSIPDQSSINTAQLQPRLSRAAKAGFIQRKDNPSATRFSGNALLERVFDGAAVVSQRSNSSGTHVRLIQESLLALGYTLPLFGADGDFGPETETAVRQFQIDAGARTLDGIIGSETMGLLDMQDPGATIGLAGPSPAPATSAVFSEDPGETFAGYDASVAPNNLVVPVNERRAASVAVTPAGSHPTYVSDTPGVATVQRTSTGIVVTGVAAGTATITAVEGATVLARLGVTVKNQIDRSVAFHYVCDSAPAPGGPHCSNGGPPANEMRSLLNHVWHRQANIRFTGGVAHNVVVPGNMGAAVDWDSTLPGGGEWATVIATGTGAAYNVFRVWTYMQDGTSPNNAANLGNNTLIGDAPCGDGWGLAHECGHFLGLGHGTGIMNPCGGRTNQRVSKAMADLVNP